jgi:hypothetical protein
MRGVKRNGVTQTRYHGKIVGAKINVVATGQAQASGESRGKCQRVQSATANPRATGTLTRPFVGKTHSSAV